jgi:hypothetical protein
MTVVVLLWLLAGAASCFLVFLGVFLLEPPDDPPESLTRPSRNG